MPADPLTIRPLTLAHAERYAADRLQRAVAEEEQRVLAAALAGQPVPEPRDLAALPTDHFQYRPPVTATTSGTLTAAEIKRFKALVSAPPPIEYRPVAPPTTGGTGLAFTGGTLTIGDVTVAPAPAPPTPGQTVILPCVHCQGQWRVQDDPRCARYRLVHRWPDQTALAGWSEEPKDAYTGPNDPRIRHVYHPDVHDLLIWPYPIDPVCACGAALTVCLDHRRLAVTIRHQTADGRVTTHQIDHRQLADYQANPLDLILACPLAATPTPTPLAAWTLVVTYPDGATATSTVPDAERAAVAAALRAAGLTFTLTEGDPA